MRQGIGENLGTVELGCFDHKSINSRHTKTVFKRFIPVNQFIIVEERKHCTNRDLQLTSIRIQDQGSQCQITPKFGQGSSSDAELSSLLGLKKFDAHNLNHNE